MNLYPPGALIAGQYEVAGRPLMGGMGIVYLCLDHGNDRRPVALKTFPARGHGLGGHGRAPPHCALLPGEVGGEQVEVCQCQ